MLILAMGLLSFLFGSSAKSQPIWSALQTTQFQPEAGFLVQLSETEVRCVRPDGGIERFNWNDLHTVTIETTDKGPLIADVFWVLAGNSDNSCVIPQGATGERALLKRLQELPGFDHETLIESMSCTDNRKFLCWKRANGTPER